MNPQTAKNTRLISDYPIDQVIYRSDIIPVSLGSFGFNDVTITNPLGVKFLPIAQFSLSPTFATDVYDENSGPWSGGVELYSTAVFVKSNGTEIKISTQNNTAPAVTLYFRIIGLPLPNDTTSYPKTSGYQEFAFNTDDNYMKLYLSDSQSLATTASMTINHNLGYKPRALFWAEDASNGIGMVTYVEPSYEFLGSTIEPKIGDNTIIVANNTFATATVYYRIYIED